MNVLQRQLHYVLSGISLLRSRRCSCLVSKPFMPGDYGRS